MVKSFVFNMGYDTSHVISVLASEGLESGSQVVLVTPGSVDNRQENAINDIRNYLDNLDIEVSLQVFGGGESLESDIENFTGLFSDLENIVLSLSGGTRDLLIPLTAAYMMNSGNVDKTVFRSDIDSSLSEIELPELTVSLSDSKNAIVEALTSASGVQEIVENVDMSESTVYRKLSELENKGVVKSEKKNGRKIYSTTVTGKALLKN